MYNYCQCSAVYHIVLSGQWVSKPVPSLSVFPVVAKTREVKEVYLFSLPCFWHACKINRQKGCCLGKNPDLFTGISNKQLIMIS